MNQLRSIWRRLRPPVAAVACWLAVYGTALAAEADNKPKASSWVQSYGVVLLAVVLGMLGVCLTSRRRERDKPQVYEKTKLTLDD